ncbi:MAG: 50S ribosomal protein L11, partial [Candidatus Bathyarchaeia archaeon]
MPAEKKIVEFIVEGGKATGGPPIGPAIGPLGVNVVAVVNKINELTKEYTGMKVP